MEHNDLLTPDELAEELKVQKSWVYSRTRTGEIPHYKIGKYVKFDPDEVRNWIKSQK